MKAVRAPLPTAIGRWGLGVERARASKPKARQTVGCFFDR